MSKQKGYVAIILIIIATLFIGYMDIFGFGANKSGSAEDIKLGLDLAGGVSITYQAVGDETPSDQDMSDTINKLQKRVEAYSTEAVVYKEGSDRISIEIPGVYDAKSILQALGRPGTLYFFDHISPNGETNYTYTSEGWTLLRSVEEMEADGSVVLVGNDVATAQAASIKNSMGNVEYVVSLSLTPDGAEKFRVATDAAYKRGQDVIAIYYDGTHYP